MATNQARWVGNLNGATEPLIMRGLFQAGATQAVKQGELLELTADSSTRWTPMDSDYNMAADVAIAAEEIRDGDRAGYYNIIVPRPGDLFSFELAAAGNNAVGTAVYWSSSEKVTITAGTYILGHIAGQEHYPVKQGHASIDGSPNMGETLQTVSWAVITIELANSWYALLQQ